jgi:hypothetical protein
MDAKMHHTHDDHEYHAERYMDRAGDMILAEMSKRADKIDHKHFAYVAELCRQYNEMCDFWEDHVEDDDGGEWDGHHGSHHAAHHTHHDEIHGELMGAEKYLRKWQETKDPVYLQLAHDELRHAKTLLGKAHGLDADKAKHYHTLHDQMAARLGGAGVSHATM